MTATEQAQTVAVGTNVIFKWSDQHNVYVMPNKAAYDACDFSQATELASTSVNEFTYKASGAGTFYFGCQVAGHCAYANQKLALTVTPPPTPAPTTTPAPGWLVMNLFCYVIWLCRKCISINHPHPFH